MAAAAQAAQDERAAGRLAEARSILRAKEVWHLILISSHRLASPHLTSPLGIASHRTSRVS
jgi:hypothetical protein